MVGCLQKYPKDAILPGYSQNVLVLVLSFERPGRRAERLYFFFVPMDAQQRAATRAPYERISHVVVVSLDDDGVLMVEWCMALYNADGAPHAGQGNFQ